MAPVTVLFYIGTLSGGVFLSSTSNGFAEERQSVIDRLGQGQGKYLVLVEYSEGHAVRKEWVYNRADIDFAPIVWARSMDEEPDRELRSYFSDVRQWILSVGPEAVLKRIHAPGPVARTNREEPRHIAPDGVH